MKTILITLVLMSGFNAHAISAECELAFSDLQLVMEMGEDALHTANFNALSDVQDNLLQIRDLTDRLFELEKPEALKDYASGIASDYKDFVFHQNIVWNNQKELRKMAIDKIRPCLK